MKNSFVLYKDSLAVLEKLTDEQAGKLFKAIDGFQRTGVLPASIDPVIDIIITPFIQQFRRDDEKYAAIVERNRKNGEQGGRPSAEPKKPSGFSGNQREPKKADSDSENDSDSESESGIGSENDPDLKKNSVPMARQNINFKKWTEEDFKQEINKFKMAYPKEMLFNFFEYWREKNNAGKMRVQLQKTWDTEIRLRRWNLNKEAFNGRSTGAKYDRKTSGAEQLLRKLKGDLGLTNEDEFNFV